MQGVLAFAVFLLLASSCSCSRLMPWSTTTDYSIENIDYSSGLGYEILSEGTTSFNVMDYGAAGNGQTDDSQVIFFLSFLVCVIVLLIIKRENVDCVFNFLWFHWKLRHSTELGKMFVVQLQVKKLQPFKYRQGKHSC